MRNIILAFLVLVCTTAYSQTLKSEAVKKEVLLIGTFHFNNPGADVAQVKTFDVMSPQAQKELETITDKIKQFHPDKIFVEWEYDDQLALDTLYNFYRQGKYFEYVGQKYPKRNFYTQNEIFQLAFKAAQKTNLAKVHAIDYTHTNFPYDSLMASVEQAKQFELKKQIEDQIKNYETTANADRQKLTLTQLLLKNNQAAYRDWDLGMYIRVFNQAGDKDNFVGAYLVSEWYRRNLYMYSLLQKLTESKDQKVMVLLGASHAALFEKFIESDSNFKVIELKNVLNK
ncbi:DUF5694 domain-containing protein [Cytophagaceae bacterium YF14B1]|uniref:DUF5694 domain-containing protein n=1 Tax=Xanthocytophaga flava TaxID=3048013 RepID=A0AAE3UAL9_9BACT|nr:DUF5694 domain-containing protein [Xanthocytophaga flavus]MDJ1486284.1 DUF5694 domain-containing protein [Xanthocytophaga flavus]